MYECHSYIQTAVHNFYHNCVNSLPCLSWYVHVVEVVYSKQKLCFNSSHPLNANAAVWQLALFSASYMWTFNLREIFECVRYLKYGKLSVQTSKHTHTHAQCSPASVGLIQACPNYNVLVQL